MGKQQIHKTGIKPKTKQTDDAKWIPRKEAISMLQCGKVKYYELVKFGLIITMTFANRAFVEKASVLRYIATHDLKYNMKRKDYITRENADGK
ncbi:MAG: hypothetical protein FWH03_08870 [Firmicutes bacterium]|nr:hypothetical protein [Bacillota bacterium]